MNRVVAVGFNYFACLLPLLNSIDVSLLSPSSTDNVLKIAYELCGNLCNT